MNTNRQTGQQTKDRLSCSAGFVLKMLQEMYSGDF
jgi:hypothetical protein